MVNVYNVPLDVYHAMIINNVLSAQQDLFRKVNYVLLDAQMDFILITANVIHVHRIALSALV